MQQSTKFQLCYTVPQFTVPQCWSITTDAQSAAEDMADLFEKTTDRISSVWVEEWRAGMLVESTHLYPDCAAEGMAS